jgi:hypothetical protein
MILFAHDDILGKAKKGAGHKIILTRMALPPIL